MYPIPATELISATAPPSETRGTSASMQCRTPTKFTTMVCRASKRGGPGTPAQTKSTGTSPPMLATAASIESGLARSTWIDSLTGAAMGAMSSAVTSAPISTSVRAQASPIPVAAPTTTQRLPS